MNSVTALGFGCCKQVTTKQNSKQKQLSLFIAHCYKMRSQKMYGLSYFCGYNCTTAAIWLVPPTFQQCQTSMYKDSPDPVFSRAGRARLWKVQHVHELHSQQYWNNHRDTASLFKGAKDTFSMGLSTGFERTQSVHAFFLLLFSSCLIPIVQNSNPYKCTSLTHASYDHLTGTALEA